MAWRLILILSVPFMVLIGCQSQESRDTQESEGTKSPAETSSKPTAKPSAPQTRPEDWAMFMHDLHFSGKSPDAMLKPPLETAMEIQDRRSHPRKPRYCRRHGLRRLDGRGPIRA